MKGTRIFAALLFAWNSPVSALASPAAPDRPFLHPLFTDHAVLQRDLVLPIWGWTRPGRRVTVRLGGKTATAVAGEDGKWMARIGPFEAGGPHTLEASAGPGGPSAAVRDILVGDVWICSGQSNMEMGIGLARDARAEIAAADHPGIRLFTVPRRIAAQPQETVASRWQVCTPETVSAGGWGGFSAAGYYFGRDLHAALKIPIGLIHTSWGGTVAEAWTRAEALRTLDDFRPAVAQLEELAAAREAGAAKFEELMARWWRENDPGSTEGAGWADPGLDDAAWKTMALPVHWEDAGLPNFDGIVWFRKEVRLPEGWAGREATLALGPIDDRDTTWVNGVRVGASDDWRAPRRYRIARGVLRAGRNVIAVRVLDTGGGGGIYGRPASLALERAGGGARIALAGPWRYKAAAPLARTSPVPRPIGNNPNVVTVLYNGMIAPLVPCGIKGAIWYQGESNAGRAAQYRRLLPTLIRNWREDFGVGDFPFLIVQLANFMAVQKAPVEPGWAELREAQWLTARNDPHAGLAVAIDIGEARDIHPKNKQAVGERLALAALGIAYGRDIEYSGPSYASMRIEGSAVRLRFTHTGGGLVPRGGGALKGFAIAGADKRFVWAKAAIEGDTVVVSSPEVPKPVAVRYGWANNPVCNLYNKAGLPASPFRTDLDAR